MRIHQTDRKCYCDHCEVERNERFDFGFRKVVYGLIALGFALVAIAVYFKGF